MAEKTLNTRQKQKYDISTNWTTNNPVLLAGELGIESDTNKFKIGNGTSAWNELDYVGGGDIMLYSTTGQNTDGAMTQKAVTDAIPTTLSDLNEDSTHRTVTDTEKSTWNNKSDFSGNYNDLTNKPTIPTVYINNQPQSELNFDSDPQTQIDNIVNNTTIIKNSVKGFNAGEFASAGQGGAVGWYSYTETGFSGGNNSNSNNGGAIGNSSVTDSGGAVGSGASSGVGFSGGYNAKVSHINGAFIDAIQLGTGTNTTEKSLQIYDDNIYNANTHTLTVQNATVGGNEVDTIEEQGINYIRYSNGIQICWGSQSWSSRNNGTFNVTFPKSFSSSPSITATATSPNLGGSASSPLTLYGENTTGFQGTVWGVGGGDRNDGMRWIAIGKWN